jgi:hypothetical protein
MSRSRAGGIQEAATGAKPTPAASPTPAAVPTPAPTAAAVLSSEYAKMRPGGCNTRQQKNLAQNAKFVFFGSCRGAEDPIHWTSPPGFFDISTHDREQLRGRQATSRPSGHPPHLRTTLGPNPRTFIAEWPEVAAGGVDSKTPPPTRTSSRDATGPQAHTPDRSTATQNWQASRTDAAAANTTGDSQGIDGKHSRPKAAGMRALFGRDDETPPGARVGIRCGRGKR